jgi:hypothetical protein
MEEVNVIIEKNNKGQGAKPADIVEGVVGAPQFG